MTIETAQTEIRAIFSNEVECIYESEPAQLANGVQVWIWAREIRLAGMNTAQGKTCVSVVNYAIHSDGYWEQIGIGHNSEWQ